MGTFPITIVARIKHGHLREAIKARGWTQKQAALFLGINQSTLGNLVRLTWIPSQRWLTKERQEKFLELTSKLPEELWPEAIRTKEFLDAPKTIEAMREVPLHFLASRRESLALPPTPEELLLDEEYHEELKRKIEEVLQTISPKERTVLRAIFFEGKTFLETAPEIGSLHASRVGQIRDKALRKLRHPSRSRKLRSFLDR